MDETGKSSLHLTTDRGDLAALDMGNGLTSVNMGQPQLDWQDIPLAHAMDTLELPIDGAPTATGMGNPHCTFFVEDVAAVDLEQFGPGIEHHPLYPERTNVQVAQVIGPITSVCGSGNVVWASRWPPGRPVAHGRGSGAAGPDRAQGAHRS